MTTRTDVEVDFTRSPRVVEIDEASDEIVAQDVVDTLRPAESEFRGMSETQLLTASGKDSLGGGVSVGITGVLQNTVIAFQTTWTPAETGTVTTGSSTPIKEKITFVDTGATFVTNNVAKGDLVINFTDQSVTEVYSVDSETQLTTRVLQNGIGNTFDVSDAYHVYSTVQKEIKQGNIVAVDDMASEIVQVQPTPFTQVVVLLSAAGTITNLSDFETSLDQAKIAAMNTQPQ